ncbi:predicted protein [Sclerotinia sclerotiorum 1980 UF-70]|uniref:Uncharacterized protein n=1 Tax=Sclerotinia sclerotiorum (strain ATCC 18683 / 1980 / Ss-1) TaxID=665079 RepID=A7EJB3_SCLS1|nr:predicted protein [Sclerotinia sclerotiorum 1980 UF-70]EDO02929.1 predicted protein [Sclerotinia sclerotiorum 1980 UF-70]
MGKLVEDVPPFTPGQNIRAQTYMYELPSRLSIHFILRTVAKTPLTLLLTVSP